MHCIVRVRIPLIMELANVCPDMSIAECILGIIDIICIFCHCSLFCQVTIGTCRHTGNNSSMHMVISKPRGRSSQLSCVWTMLCTAMSHPRGCFLVLCEHCMHGSGYPQNQCAHTQTLPQGIQLTQNMLASSSGRMRFET